MATIRGLKSLIYAHFDSESSFATSIGWTRQRLNRITSGRKEPTIGEVNAISAGLNEPVEIIAAFFLSEKSPNGQRRAI